MSESTRDPREFGPKPPFPDQKQNHPGSVKMMDPQPDHGETSYTGTGKLKGRAALITGGDSGIGRAIAIAFAKEGADVLISYLPEEESDAAKTAEEVQKAGGKAIKVPGDISERDTPKKLV